MKAECWELIGMSKQRMGSVSASETATGTNTAMQQSYSQTEPLFIAHEYVLGQFYQAIIDASLYIASSQEQSTLSYITSEGQSSFVQVNGTDLKFRDLKVFLTNRPEDTQMFNEIRMLAQPFMQNGGSLYDVIEMYSTKSQRELKKTFKDLRDQQTKQQEQASAQAQQQLDQQNQQAQAQLAQVAEQFQANQAREDYQNELDRINKKKWQLLMRHLEMKMLLQIMTIMVLLMLLR
jgi:DNA-binding transcriptional MerR regulator